MNVMMAKLEAILRRTYGMGGKLSVMEHLGAVLNLSDQTLSVDGRRIELTKNEFRILQMLMENGEKS